MTRTNPPSPEDAEEDRITAAVANLTLAWAEIENACVLLLTVILGHDHLSLASAIYFAPSSLKTRLAIMDLAFCELANGAPHEAEITACWRSILHRLNRLKAVRDQVAHGQIVTRRARGKAYTRVTAPLLHRAKFCKSERAGQLPGLSAHDIEQAIDRANALAKRITAMESLARCLHDGDEGALLETLARLRAGRQN